VTPGDHVALGEAINALLADPMRRQMMGKCAEARVRKNFRWALVAEQALKGYGAVIEST
jgi:glycosyltransferase involved in cell wall biosynthesis